jgi:hypothetical protein
MEELTNIEEEDMLLLFMTPEGFISDATVLESTTNNSNISTCPVDSKYKYTNPSSSQIVSITPPSGIAEDSLWRYAPFVGSSADAYDNYKNGNIGWGIAYTLLAVSDVFLIRSLVTGVGKAVVKEGSKAFAKSAAKKDGIGTITKETTKGISKGAKKYFGYGMSHSFEATKLRLQNLGIIKKGVDVHHVFLSQKFMEKHSILKKFGNQAWNFKVFSSHEAHIRFAHFKAYPKTGKGKIPFAVVLYPFSSTPNWARLGAIPQSLRLLDHGVINEGDDYIGEGTIADQPYYP